MIPVEPKPEPSDFDTKVRQRGKAFLQTAVQPIKWDNRKYWREALPDLCEAYGEICAYCCEWISPTTGASTVEHFKPKSKYPDEAYEWNNYRLVCGRFNGVKGDYGDVLDPFALPPGWFTIRFPELTVHPADHLTSEDTVRVVATIKRLKLSETSCVKARQKWLQEYAKKEVTFQFLKRRAPFIAQELERQGLIETIGQIMRFDQAPHMEGDSDE